MAVSTICVAPSEALSIAYSASELGIVNALVGELAERLIEADYLAARPGVVFGDHYFDNPITSSYIAFLAAHNAALRTPAKLAQLAILTNIPGGGITRPDILTDQLAIREYYEIKPDSPDGSVAGAAKLFSIAAFMGLFGLAYAPGTSFTPAMSIPLASGSIPTILGRAVPFSATLSVRRSGPALIQYKVCVTTDFAAIGATALAVIASIIVAILLGGAPVLIPAPALLPVVVLA